jgi:IMP dehydrogenase
MDIVDFDLAGVRVGLGGGSICTTSEVTGVGVPILQAVEEVATVLAHSRTKVIADGGVRNSGDIAKALAAGAHCVMLGRIFAATSESGGEAKEIGGEWYKRYEGNLYPTLELSPQSGTEAQVTLSAISARGGHRAEGISGYIRQTGSAELVLQQIAKALAASLAFVGARSLDEFRAKARLELVSKSSLEASRSHGVDIVTHKDRLMVA